ncbi:hypothetical protein PTTG_30744, partial [Puccinia triticina 1-1 BBBD Race 1]
MANELVEVAEVVEVVEEIAEAVVPMAYAVVMPPFMMNNRAIINAMPQLPPALASNPTTTPTSGSNITSLYPSRSASVYSASSVATAEDFLTPQTRVPSPNPLGFYDPADFHRLTRDQVVSLLDRRSAPKLFDRYMFVPQYIDDLYQSIMSALVHHFQRFPAANAEERASRVSLFRFITRRYRTMTRHT